MKDEYTYPLEEDWNIDEICTVIDFYNCIESAYEVGIDHESLMIAYQAFKKIVDSKSLERKISDDFQKESGYSIYETMQFAKTNDFIKMK